MPQLTLSGFQDFGISVNAAGDSTPPILTSGFITTGHQSGKFGALHGVGYHVFDINIPKQSTINGIRFDIHISDEFNSTGIQGRFFWLNPDGNWDVTGHLGNYALAGDVPCPYRANDAIVDLSLASSSTTYIATYTGLVDDTETSIGDNLSAALDVPGLAGELDIFLKANEASRGLDDFTGIPCCFVLHSVFPGFITADIDYSAEDTVIEANRPTMTIDYTPRRVFIV